jgi:hypothetical protein
MINRITLLLFIGLAFWSCEETEPTITNDGSILGCTDSLANNYNPLATKNDGSCEYDVYGCTDPFALNYNPAATIDDGSCEYASPPNIVKTGSGEIYSYNSPYGYVGFRINLKNEGETTSANGQFKIKVCFEYQNVTNNYIYTYHFPDTYLPAIQPNATYTHDTGVVQVVNSDISWTISCSCTNYYYCTTITQVSN